MRVQGQGWEGDREQTRVRRLPSGQPRCFQSELWAPGLAYHPRLRGLGQHEALIPQMGLEWTFLRLVEVSCCPDCSRAWSTASLWACGNWSCWTPLTLAAPHLPTPSPRMDRASLLSSGLHRDPIHSPLAHGLLLRVPGHPFTSCLGPEAA